MALKPGDAVTEDNCEHVDKFPFGVLTNPDALALDPGVFDSLPALSARKQDYIDTFDARELEICNEDQFAIKKSPLVLHLQKKKEEPDPAPGPYWYMYHKMVVYACLHASTLIGGQVSIYYTSYKGMPFVWMGIPASGYNTGVVVNIQTNPTCPHGYNFPTGETYRFSPTNHLLTFLSPLHSYPGDYVFTAPFMMKTCVFSTNFDGDDLARLDFDFVLGSVIMESVNPPPTLFWLSNSDYQTKLLYDYKPYLDEMIPCTKPFIQAYIPRFPENIY